MHKIVKIFFVFALILTITACQIQEKNRYEAQFLGLFDTVTQIVSYMDRKEEFSEEVNQIHDELEQYHKLYDIYTDYPGFVNIKAINDNAGKQPVMVDRRIIDLLLFAKEVYRKTNGKVNVALGSVLSIWHDYREKGTEDPENAKLPPMDLLKAAAQHSDINKVNINESASTVFLEDPDMSLDVGAIAKGFAVEQVSERAIRRGFTSGLISVGGNVKVIGAKKSSKEPWNVGIQNPASSDGESNLLVVNLSNQSLVTSGNYSRYYTVKGKEYHHIINPDTLYPAEYFTAITIICEDSGEADALSTAVYNMPLQDGLGLIESLPNTEAFWVLPNGEQKFSTGFQKLLAE
ncbi:MAG: FAD:protein FMN transferase [Atribacterota bacterium]